MFLDKRSNLIGHGKQLCPLLLIERDGKATEAIDRHAALPANLVDAEFGLATGDGSTAVGCVGAAVVVPGGAVDPAVAAGFAVGGEGRPPTRRASVSDSRPRGLTWAGSKSGRATSTPGCFKCRRRVGRLQPGRVVSGPGPYPPASVPWILQKRCRPCSRACVPS